MVNLLEETVEVLEEYGKTLEDIEWIGGEDFSISKQRFIILANSLYDNGFGGQEVAKDLVLVGNGFWLERKEYDGSEWWEYKELPIRHFEEDVFAITFNQTKGGYKKWVTLKEMNEKEEV